MVSCQLGEGPLWDEQKSRLLWVDISRGTIHERYPHDHRHIASEFSVKIGAIVLDEDGEVIAATHHGFARMDLSNQSIIPIADPEPELPNNRFNDGKCDSRGRFWAGTMDEVTGKGGAGSLYVLDKEGRVTTKLTNITCSNGLAWSLDHQTLYYIDTGTRQVQAFDFEAVTGNIANGRVIIDVPESEGLPDGMTIDQEGMLWIALWGGWKVARWNPQTGEKLDEIIFPASQITSCTFGGADFNDLYVTSARTGLDKQALTEQPYAGSLFVVKNMGCGGMPAARFTG